MSEEDFFFKILKFYKCECEKERRKMKFESVEGVFKRVVGVNEVP